MPSRLTPTAILVIKHGALGDFIQALPAIRALRLKYPHAHLALQTTPALERLARPCPWLDAVDPEGRPAKLRARLALARRVRRDFDLIVDLQNSERTAMMFYLATPAPAWSGVVLGASHAFFDSQRTRKHASEALADQVVAVGADRGVALAPPDLRWAIPADFSLARFGLDSGRFAVLAAMASPGRDVKRWPGQRFAALAGTLGNAGIIPVFVGAAVERAAIAALADAVPGARNLAGETDLADLAGLCAHARIAVGNDTGPMFIAAAAGAPCLVLYSRHSQPPERCAPRGAGGVMTLKGGEMSDIAETAVAKMLQQMGVLSP
jgi:ADP-heptose:LPS heptosyltransferase